jgi:hypothetical protein
LSIVRAVEAVVDVGDKATLEREFVAETVPQRTFAGKV